MEEKSIAMEIASELKAQNVRLAKSNRNSNILCVILVIAIIINNIAWLIYESQYEYVATDTITTTTMQDVNDADLDNTSVIQY